MAFALQQKICAGLRALRSMIERTPRDIERECSGIGDVQALDLAGHIEAGQQIAGLTGERAQALALGAHHERERSLERRVRKISGARFIEADEKKAARF